MINYKFTFIDLFAGIGGIRLGFEAAGGKCVFSSEINSAAQQTYFANFGETPFGDITKIEENTIPDFDILLAGFPCQPFSISGRKKGFEDTRGTLFFDICRIIRIKKPKVIFLENVKYLLHHDSGNTFKVILRSLSDLGYKVSFKLLNAKDFGLPQNRERIVIVASKLRQFNFDIIDYVKSKPLSSFLDKDNNLEYVAKDEYTLLETSKVQKQNSGLIFVGYRNKDGWKKGVRPNTMHLSRVHRQPNRIYSVEGFHPTIPSQETAGRFFIYIPTKNEVRKLTLNEIYRIMGFPENFIKHVKISEQYKQIGNSVAIPMIKEIAKSIINQNLLNDDTRSEVKGYFQQVELSF